MGTIQPVARCPAFRITGRRLVILGVEVTQCAVGRRALQLAQTVCCVCCGKGGKHEHVPANRVSTLKTLNIKGT